MHVNISVILILLRYMHRLRGIMDLSLTVSLERYPETGAETEAEEQPRHRRRHRSTADSRDCRLSRLLLLC